MSEFYPQPDEFNLGYKPSHHLKEKRKNRKWKLARKLKILLTSTLLVMPLTINIGLWDINSFKFGPGTYQSSTSYVHFDENSGWFYNGDYFIPLVWDSADYTYSASGAYPATMNVSEIQSDYYLVNSSGDIEVTNKGFYLLDPFTQEKQFYTYMDKDAAIEKDVNPDLSSVILEGSWNGTIKPYHDYPAAYPQTIGFEDGQAILLIANTYNDYAEIYPLSYQRDGASIIFTPQQPITYTVTANEKDYAFIYDAPIHGILFFSDDGVHLALNVFNSQVFTKLP